MTLSKKYLLMAGIILASSSNLLAGNIKGKIIDAMTKECLVGANIILEGTNSGASADFDGNFSINAAPGTYNILVSYIGYKKIVKKNVKIGSDDITINFEMQEDKQTLGEVTVTAKKNLEGERALQVERMNRNTAVEFVGAKEMSVKGIGNVQEGVKTVTGISVADAGQLIVRGLGDRYSSTTLNGLPIASPNPDNKLVPLDLFPSNMVQNISVSKVYNATEFADYSGAHIDISTKENVREDFLHISLNTGGKTNSLFSNRFSMDRSNSLLQNPSMDKAALNMSLAEFDSYSTQNNIFKSTFGVNKSTTLPDFGATIGFGKNLKIGSHNLSILASVSAKTGFQNMNNAFYKTLEATGTIQNNFNYDSFSQELETAALAHIGYTLRSHDRIGYVMLFSRSANDTYQLREGIDSEGHNLVGSNNNTHIYSLINHQINGLHYFGTNDKWTADWDASFANTSSDEPDRRQVMFQKDNAGRLSLFKLNRQETMRYFGALDENEWNASSSVKYTWNDTDCIKFGINYKNKSRNYKGTRFYYNLNRLNADVTDIYNTDAYLNFGNIANGNIIIERKMQPKDSYKAANNILATYLQSDFHPTRALLLNIGLRMEMSKQWVKYASDGGELFGHRRDLNKTDLFPSLNMKYELTPQSNLRFASSRTITRPSFIEMAPFLYQESYGSAQIRGNEDLQNGYNYNFDLRYEFIAKSGDMLSATAYYKYLDNPIERIQALQGGATLHSFQNANNGMAYGVEVEVRKNIIKGLRFGTNVSYMHTNVKLPEGGAYTNKERSLQGASPILVNADLTYSLNTSKNHTLNIALLYNLQGSRIHAVGVSRLGDVKQQAVHTLNLNASFNISKKFDINLKATDLLNRDMVFCQEVHSLGKSIEVERYKKGTGIEIGLSYKL